MTVIVSGWGPDPRFWVLVYGHETCRPNTDAVSAKLERHVAAEAGDSTKKAMSSAYTKLVKRSRPTVIPDSGFHVSRYPVDSHTEECWGENTALSYAGGC